MAVLDCQIPKKAWTYGSGERNGVPEFIGRHGGENTKEDAGPWEPTVRKIAEFKNLGDDWDGLGAKAPVGELLESAIGLAYLFYEKGVDPPHCVVPGVDGSVTFEWQSPDGTFTEVEIVRPFHAEVMMIEPGKPAKHWTLPTE